MKKASKILLTIAGVIGLIAGIGLMVAGLIYGLVVIFGGAEAMPELAAAIQAMLDDMGSDLDAEAIAWIIRIGVGLVIMLIYGGIGLFELITGIIALKGAKAKKKGILIANIVFGVLFQNYLSIVGAVLGIIGLSIEANKAAQGEAQPEPEPVPAPAPAPAPVVEEKKAEPVKEEPKEEPKPAPAPARKDWFCPNCGAHNEGKFCAACGTKKPE